MRLSSVLVAIAAATSMALSGCATRRPAYQPTAAEIEAGERGALPANYQDLIRTYMRSVLKDPESARWEFASTPPRKSFVSRSEDRQGVEYRWLIDAKVNAKNSYGGYVGEHDFVFMIKDGRVIDHVDSTQNREDIDRLLRRLK